MLQYGPVKPGEAGDIFIRQALIPGEIDPLFPFLVHNLKIEQYIQEMENRIRRRDIRVSDEHIFRFYKKHLPRVYDVRTLNKIIHQKGGDDFLMLNPENLMRYEPAPEELAEYPESIRFGEQLFPLKYWFETGQEQDGVTVNVPAPLADAITPEQTEWLIPGLFKEKIETLIKGLPKQFRKKLVPISSTLQVIVNEMPRDNAPLASSLSHFLHARVGVDIPASAWPVESLPNHLKMRIAIMDSREKIVLAGRDITHLKKKLVQKPDPDGLLSAKTKWEKKGIVTWDFGDIPESVTLTGRHHAAWVLYPGLEICEKDLSLRLFADKTRAVMSHKKGVAWLFEKSLSKELKFLRINLRLLPAFKKPATYFGGCKSIQQDMYQHVVDTQFQIDIRKQAHFLSRVETFKKEDIHLKGQDLLEKTTQVLSAVHEARTAIHQLETTNLENSKLSQFLAELKHEMSRLVPRHFVRLYGGERLTHIVRYVKGMQIRAQRAVVNFEKDRIREKTVSGFVSKLNTLIANLSPDAGREKRKAVEALFWLLEEFKVSLFAQELKTTTRVSEKRLKVAIQEIERMV
jgi:ATP-dependent helicase HrpA